MPTFLADTWIREIIAVNVKGKAKIGLLAGCFSSIV